MVLSNIYFKSLINRLQKYNEMRREWVKTIINMTAILLSIDCQNLSGEDFDVCPGLHSQNSVHSDIAV